MQISKCEMKIDVAKGGKCTEHVCQALRTESNTEYKEMSCLQRSHLKTAPTIENVVLYYPNFNTFHNFVFKMADSLLSLAQPEAWRHVLR